MDVSKISKPVSSEASETLQKENSQQTESTSQATSRGFDQTDGIEKLDSTRASNLFEAVTAQASDQEGLKVVTGSGGTTVLGHSAEDSAPVSESYAAKKETSAASGKSESYSSIRKEIADALGVAESDPSVDTEYVKLAVQSREQLEANMLGERQTIIDDALKYGRREETKLAMDMTEFKEYVPIPDSSDYAVRWGTDTLNSGLFSDEIARFTRYLGNGQVLGTVWSVIKDGVETVTKVDESVPGSIGLKIGDQRTLPDPTNSAAGKKPSTWDPQPDGRYGSASGSTTNTSQPSSSQDSGSSGLGPSSLHDPDFVKFTSAEAKESKSSGTPTSTAASGGNPETRAGAVHVYHKEGSGDWEDRGTQWTENPPTEVTVEEPETDESLAEEEEVEAGGDDNQAAWGDYADTGPAPPAQQGEDAIVSESSGKSYYRAAESQPMIDPNTGKSTLTDTSGYADKPGGPIDYGNPTDPNANPFIPDSSDIAAHIGPDPTVTDPGQGEGGDDAATLDSSIRLDMAGTLRDAGNPVDPFATEAPAGNRPNTTDAERPSDDDFLP